MISHIYRFEIEHFAVRYSNNAVWGAKSTCEKKAKYKAVLLYILFLYATSPDKIMLSLLASSPFLNPVMSR